MNYYKESDCKLSEFQVLVGDTLSKSSVPYASEVVDNVPIYDMQSLSTVMDNLTDRQHLQAEWADVLLNRSGVVALQKTYTDTTIIDEASRLFLDLINEEKENKPSDADHFAAAGSNDRLWNSLQKMAGANPDLYTRYFANPNIDAVCESWLGPCYQMTAQINLVYPGGQAQRPHRDYHMGFQTIDTCERYPAHVHGVSPLLTLQGAIAHCDMNAENGVTQLLPFSQLYQPGYLAYRQDEFRNFFEDHYVQVPLKKGDTVFFNPALFHAAGENKSTDVNRLGNLLQVSSAYGRSLENLDRQMMCESIYPELQQKLAEGALSDAECHAVIAATAEGYSFPTNLDTDPPVGGLAPETQQQIMRRCLTDKTPVEEFHAQLKTLANKQKP